MRTDGKNIPFPSTAENKWDLFKKKIVEKRKKSVIVREKRERECVRLCFLCMERERERVFVCVCVCVKRTSQSRNLS